MAIGRARSRWIRAGAIPLKQPAPVPLGRGPQNCCLQTSLGELQRLWWAGERAARRISHSRTGTQPGPIARPPSVPRQARRDANTIKARAALEGISWQLTRPQPTDVEAPPSQRPSRIGAVFFLPSRSRRPISLHVSVLVILGSGGVASGEWSG